MDISFLTLSEKAQFYKLAEYGNDIYGILFVQVVVAYSVFREDSGIQYSMVERGTLRNILCCSDEREHPSSAETAP